jgi:hypothetical protein
MCSVEGHFLKYEIVLKIHELDILNINFKFDSWIIEIQ